MAEGPPAHRMQEEVGHVQEKRDQQWHWKGPATSGFGVQSHEKDHERTTLGMVAQGEAATKGCSNEKWCQNEVRIVLHGSNNQGKETPAPWKRQQAKNQQMEKEKC